MPAYHLETDSSFRLLVGDLEVSQEELHWTRFGLPLGLSSLAPFGGESNLFRTLLYSTQQAQVAVARINPSHGPSPSNLIQTILDVSRLGGAQEMRERRAYLTAHYAQTV